MYSTDVQVYVRKDIDSLAPTAKWGQPPFILEWSELYDLLNGAGWLQETSGRPVKLRAERLTGRYNPSSTSDRPDPATSLIHLLDDISMTTYSRLHFIDYILL